MNLELDPTRPPDNDLLHQRELRALATAESEAGVNVVSIGGRRQRAFYRFLLQPSLFGGHDLVREWGPIPAGRSPAALVESFPDPRSQRAGLRAGVRAQLRKGYRQGVARR